VRGSMSTSKLFDGVQEGGDNKDQEQQNNASKPGAGLHKLYNYLLYWVSNNKETMKENWGTVATKLKDFPKELDRIQRVVNGEEKPPPMPVKASDHKTLNEDILRLKTEQKECDFVLKIEDEKIHSIPCHKPILACRCDYFAGVFRSGMTEAQKGEMTIPGPDQQGLTVSALDGLLTYFYSNHVSHLTDPFDCLYILGSAGYFSLSNEFGNRHTILLDHCQQTVVETGINLGNCVKLFHLSSELNVEDINVKIYDFLAKNYNELSKTEDFKQLPLEVREQLSSNKSANN